jgi:hypothetical protein
MLRKLESCVNPIFSCRLCFWSAFFTESTLENGLFLTREGLMEYGVVFEFAIYEVQYFCQYAYICVYSYKNTSVGVYMIMKSHI